MGAVVVHVYTSPMNIIIFGYFQIIVDSSITQSHIIIYLFIHIFRSWRMTSEWLRWGESEDQILIIRNPYKWCIDAYFVVVVLFTLNETGAQHQRSVQFNWFSLFFFFICHFFRYIFCSNHFNWNIRIQIKYIHIAIHCDTITL